MAKARPRSAPLARRAPVAAAVVVLAVALVYLSAIPAAVWRGVMVEEGCQDRFGKAELASAVRTEWRWLPPHWSCTSSRGDRSWLYPWGGSR